ETGGGRYHRQTEDGEAGQGPASGRGGRQEEPQAPLKSAVIQLGSAPLSEWPGPVSVRFDRPEKSSEREGGIWQFRARSLLSDRPSFSVSLSSHSEIHP